MLQVRPPSFFVRKQITNTSVPAPLATPLARGSSGSQPLLSVVLSITAFKVAPMPASSRAIPSPVWKIRTSVVRTIYHLGLRRPSDSQYISKIAAPPLLTAALRHLRVIVPWSAAETAPRAVVASADSTCTITPARTFHRLPLRPRMTAVARKVCPQVFPSFPISRLDGRTTLAGCRLSLHARGVETC